MAVNLEKAHKAMQSFLGEDGGKSLEKFSSAISTLKKAIPVKLNDEEFDHVLKALINQRSLSSIVKPTKGGFVILSSVEKVKF